MGVKIYGSFRSPFVMTVVLTAYEKDLDFEVVSVDMKSSEYINNFNPFGKIPAYEDDDIKLFESRAIMRYIATRFADQGAPLLGSSLNDQALSNQWLDVNGLSFTPALLDVGRTVMANPSDIEGLKAGLEKLEKILDIYEARLSVSKYLAGDTYTIADAAHTPMFYIYHALGNSQGKHAIDSRPHLSAWIDDISSRPAWMKVLDRPENTFYRKVTPSPE